MQNHGGRSNAFGEVWPLLAFRYGIIAIGVLVWLWESKLDTRVALGAVLFSLMLVLELPVYASGQIPGRAIWAAAQFVVGVAAFAVHPGLSTGIVLSAVVCGIVVSAPMVVVMVAVGVLSIVTILWVDAPVSTLAALISLYGFAIVVGYLFLQRLQERRRHRATIEQLEQAQERIAAFADTARDLAATHERQRLTEELHDTLGHALVGTLLQVQIARKLLATNPGAVNERLHLVETNVRDTLEQVRIALHRGTQRRGQLPLHLALESLVADFTAAGGPDVELLLLPDQETVSDVSHEIAQVLYRTTQEALTNAVRHGRATLIKVQVETLGNRVYLRIADNGLGADQYVPGMGLSGMVSRVQEVGGSLRFHTAPGQGFQVEVGVRRR